jgi:hypothetical protein
MGVNINDIPYDDGNFASYKNIQTIVDRINVYLPDFADSSSVTKNYVDNQDNLRTTFTYVDTSLNVKANRSYVDGSLGVKANQSYVDASLVRVQRMTKLYAYNNLT